MFYRRGEMLRRVGFFYCAAPLSGAIGGLLATGLSKIRTHEYHGWPFIFFVEVNLNFNLAVLFNI